LRRFANDNISNLNRLSIILGAIVGAFVGSRLVGYLENPMITLNALNIIQLLNTKSIMGGLFGGLLGVETAKKIINEKQSSGDLFTFPIIVGIFIGRIGCFLTGIKEFTYGKETDFFMGMNLGDGLKRHPTSLYELIFLGMLFIVLKRIAFYTKNESGLLFKIFMIAYFGFRFFIEFLKPNSFHVAGLSSIQWLCITCWMYYMPTFKKLMRNAN
jgi:prolipoprotein diacylglyceryltransferase